MVDKDIKLVDVVQVMLVRLVLPCQRRACNLWEYDPAEHQTLRELYGSSHNDIWKVLFKSGKLWPDSAKHRGYQLSRSASPEWTKKAGRIHFPAPLPEELVGLLLTKMLVPAPYEAPKKEASKKVKKTRSGLCHRDASDAKSEDSSDDPSSEDEEEEEEDESSMGEGKKRTASSSLEAELPKRRKSSLPEASTTAAHSRPEGDPRAQPLVNPARSRSGQPTSEDSLSSDALESETPPEASSPEPRRDTEVSSQRDLDHGEHISGAGYTGAAVPMLVNGEGDRRSSPQPDTVLETLKAPGSGEQPPLMGGLPDPPATSVQAELPGGLLTALKNASIVDEHRALMCAVIEKIQFAESGLNESCLSIIKGLETSAATTASHHVEVSGLKQSLEWAEEELVRVKKQLEDRQGASAEIEALKKAVAEANKKAAAEQALREKHEARVVEAERDLQDAVKKSETLEQILAEKESELAQALQAANDAREEARGALKDIQEAWRIAAGALADLPRSISDAAQLYRTEEKKSAEKHFWSQYLAPNYQEVLITTNQAIGL
nr:neurofilament heavy polypeptide-like [Aegilops tauschii subsp. strangulata]